MGTSLVVAVDDVDDVVVGENEKKNQKKKKMQVVRPKEHIFLREKASWFEILGTGEKEEDGVARYEGFDDSFLRDLREWEDGGRRRRADLGGV
ncbi:MAG: hypothetical protein M1837_002386 [Sclerophora amabilis]|nr:MAG: hypothetical protein M1837_002386 [Sclerophora amabilis]